MRRKSAHLRNRSRRIWSPVRRPGASSKKRRDEKKYYNVTVDSTSKSLYQLNLNNNNRNNKHPPNRHLLSQDTSNRLTISRRSRLRLV